MESVNYEYFDSENDYSKNPNATKHRSFNFSRGNFSKYAILNGFYGKNRFLEMQENFIHQCVEWQ